MPRPKSVYIDVLYLILNFGKDHLFSKAFLPIPNVIIDQTSSSECSDTKQGF